MRQLVDCAKQALEEENLYIESCFKKRGWKICENGPGICDNLNERYYQFVIWRGLMSSLFRWRSRTERKDYDLAFYDDETGKLEAVAEIKGWWSDSGERELPGIKRDLKGKLEIASVPGVMLILTSQLAEDAEDNFHWLAHELGINRTDMEISSFPVSAALSDEGRWEFAVIGFLARSQALPATA